MFLCTMQSGMLHNIMGLNEAINSLAPVLYIYSIYSYSRFQTSTSLQWPLNNLYEQMLGHNASKSDSDQRG